MKISIKVIANAKKSEVISDKILKTAQIPDGQRVLKIKVNTPPQDGKANAAIIDLLAEYFNIKKSQITILKGHTSSNKIIFIY